MTLTAYSLSINPLKIVSTRLVDNQMSFLPQTLFPRHLFFVLLLSKCKWLYLRH